MAAALGAHRRSLLQCLLDAGPELPQQRAAGGAGDIALGASGLAQRLRAVEVAVPRGGPHLHPASLRDVHPVPEHPAAARAGAPEDPALRWHPGTRPDARRLRHPDHDLDLPQLLRGGANRADRGGAHRRRQCHGRLPPDHAADLHARVCGGADLAVHQHLERVSLRRHPHPFRPVADHGGAERPRRLAARPLRGPDGGSAAHRAAAARDLHRPRALFHTRVARGRP